MEMLYRMRSTLKHPTQARTHARTHTLAVSRTLSHTQTQETGKNEADCVGGSLACPTALARGCLCSLRGGDKAAALARDSLS